MMVSGAPAFAGLGMLFFGMMYFVVVIGVAITLLVCLWRGMRAHESIAESLRTIAEAQPRSRDLPRGDV